MAQRKKAVIALVLTFMLTLAIALPTYATYGQKSVTIDSVTTRFYLSYTSYIDSLGRKLVTNGSLTIAFSSKTRTVTKYVPKLRLIDGGRTYSASATVNYKTETNIAKTINPSAEFCYKA